jgi:hypothetical protein
MQTELNQICLNESARSLIGSKFDIVATFDLKDAVNTDILLNAISQFQNANFGLRQRILILHHETDYYPTINHDGVVGNTIFNLFKLISTFNVPSEKILFLTNHYNIQEEIDRVALFFNLTAPQVVYTSQWYDFPKIEEITDQINSPKEIPPISSLYCCLNGVERMHRLLTLCYFKATGILKHGLISYHFNTTSKR